MKVEVDDRPIHLNWLLHVPPSMIDDAQHVVKHLKTGGRIRDLRGEYPKNEKEDG